MVKCSNCWETQLPSCSECGDEFVEKDFIYCIVNGKHSHRDCTGMSKARIIK